MGALRIRNTSESDPHSYEVTCKPWIMHNPPPMLILFLHLVHSNIACLQASSEGTPMCTVKGGQTNGTVQHKRQPTKPMEGMKGNVTNKRQVLHKPKVLIIIDDKDLSHFKSHFSLQA